MTIPLGPIDVAVLVASFGAAVAVGLLTAGRIRSLDAYLLGDRDLPWWVILGSIVATETSAATVLSVPGESFGAAGMRFLQLPLGYMLGRIAIVRYLLPLYFRGELNTAHEVLRDRFGPPGVWGRWGRSPSSTPCSAACGAWPGTTACSS
jgi:Na+/proline symporter